MMDLFDNGVFAVVHNMFLGFTELSCRLVQWHCEGQRGRGYNGSSRSRQSSRVFNYSREIRP